jgi:hypothetical protein
MNPSPMLPTNEVDTLTMTVTAALDFAARVERRDHHWRLAALW